MSQINPKEIKRDERVGDNWSSLYRLAGALALLCPILALTDIGLSFAGADVGVRVMTAQDWFGLYQRNWFLGLRNFGMLNVISLTLFIPLYLALYRLHRKAVPAYAALALVLFLFGTAIYVANNRALALLTLSNQYASADTEAEKTLLAAAGTVTLAQAEDFTPGTFPGFLLSSVGTISMLVVMLAGGVFSKRFALVGLVGSSCLLIFTISVTFAPQTMTALMILAVIGGFLMMGWTTAMGLAMLRLGRSSAGQPAQFLRAAS